MTENVWNGLIANADDQAVAEHALRFLGKHPFRGKLWVKTTVLKAAVGMCSWRWRAYPGDVHAFIRADRAVRRAWDRMIASGAIIWKHRQPLIFTC